MKSCACGGTFRRTDIVSSYSEQYKRTLYSDTDPLKSNWACKNCGATQTRAKRQPAPKVLYKQFTEQDKIWPLCKCGHLAQDHHKRCNHCLRCERYDPSTPLTVNQQRLELSHRQKEARVAKTVTKDWIRDVAIKIVDGAGLSQGDVEWVEKLIKEADPCTS